MGYYLRNLKQVGTNDWGFFKGGGAMRSAVKIGRWSTVLKRWIEERRMKRSSK